MTTTQLLTRDSAATLERRDALARPSSFNAEARTIEAVIATRSPVTRRDQRGEYDEVLDIDGADLSAFRGASVLDSHNQDSGVAAVIGSVQDAWLEGDAIVARLALSNRPEVAGIVADIGAGLIRGVSAGYEVSEWRDSESGGRRIRTAVKWRPREVSFVCVPADPNARTRSQETRAAVNRQIRELGLRAGVSVDALIDREASVEEARSAMFNAMLERGRTPITVLHTRSHDDPQQFIRAAGEALYTRINPRHTPGGPAREFIGLSIADLARETLRRRGESISGLAAHALVTRALGGLHTTSDFALILGDVVGRTLAASYAAVPSAIRRVARESTLPDFRLRSRLALDPTAIKLEKVDEHGEFRSGTIGESGESYKLDTFGRIFGITRQALVNDDLGAFSDIAGMLGAAAAGFEAQFIVDLLEGPAGVGPKMADGKAVFHTDHGNLAAGGAVPGDTTLSAARLAMRKQRSPSGELVAVTPKYLVVPSELETTAEKLLTAIQAVTVDDVNPFSRLSLIVEPRLTSTTRWYLVSDDITGIEVAYLAGEPGPQTETQVGFHIDGVEVRVRLDFGGGWMSPLGWYANAGTGG